MGEINKVDLKEEYELVFLSSLIIKLVLFMVYQFHSKCVNKPLIQIVSPPIQKISLIFVYKLKSNLF